MTSSNAINKNSLRKKPADNWSKLTLILIVKTRTVYRTNKTTT